MGDGIKYWAEKEEDERLDRLAKNDQRINDVLAQLTSEQLAQLMQRHRKQFAEEYAKREAGIAYDAAMRKFGL